MMWRKVLAVVALGLLVSGSFGDALATKPPIRGKGSPTQWGDPDWPALIKVRDEKKQVAVKYWIEPIPTDGRAPGVTQAGSISHDWRRHRWPSRRYEVKIFGRTIVIRR